MKELANVYILGSCATRDAFEYPFSEALKLVDYTARTSLASLACQPKLDDAVLEGAQSNFQKRMIERDMTKSFWKRLETYESGVLIIDLVDDRFMLGQFSGGSAHTMSVDYKSAQRTLEIEKFAHLRFHDSRFVDLWMKGFHRLEQVMKNSSRLRLFVNCVYFVPTAPAGVNGSENVAKMNEYLKQRYAVFRESFGENALIEYPAGSLLADTNHKWGHAPFHYEERAYRHLVEEITARLGALELSA